MPPPNSSATDKLWLEAFRRALVKKVKEPVGGGWLTAMEFAKKANLSRGHTGEFLKEEVAAGRMERFVGSQIAPTGRPTQQVWYRPVACAPSSGRR